MKLVQLLKKVDLLIVLFNWPLHLHKEHSCIQHYLFVPLQLLIIVKSKPCAILKAVGHMNFISICLLPVAGFPREMPR